MPTVGDRGAGNRGDRRRLRGLQEQFPFFFSSHEFIGFMFFFTMLSYQNGIYFK